MAAEKERVLVTGVSRRLTFEDKHYLSFHLGEAHMRSSRNTFGTFLNTFNNLEKESNRSIDQQVSTDVLMHVVKDIAASGDKKPVADIVKSLDFDGSRIFSAVVEGKQKGLFEVTDNHGESLATLTPLGRAFSR
jgi:hypothetical protein